MFFSDEVGIELTTWGLLHFLLLFMIIVGVALIYIFKDKIRESQYEVHIRYSIAIFAIVLELGLIFWKIGNGDTNVFSIAPIGLCAFSLYLAIYILFTKSYKVFEVSYFWAIGGVISVLFPDILYSYDRFRFYQFMMGHMTFFFMYMYMVFVHNYLPNFKSWLKSAKILIVVIIIFIFVDHLVDQNYFFLLRSDGTPFEIFEGNGYILYLLGITSLSAIVMYIWFLPLYLYTKYIYKKTI